MASLNLTACVSVLQSLIGSADRPVALHGPEFAGNEWAYVKECLDTGWVSSVGSYVDRFEADLARMTGARHAVAVVNGTAALHISLMLVDVRPQDEVIVPALTFVATANAVAYCGAMPHFADSSPSTLGLDPHKLDLYLREIAAVTSDGCINRKTGRRIRAVVPMHTFGHPVELGPLVELCARFRLELVEDAAESMGSFYLGRHTGTWGRLGVLSFNGNKIITTGGGGAIVTDDPALARRAKHLTTTARVPHQWAYTHDEIGYNYRLPNLNAALGCAQLEALPELLRRKRVLAERYAAAFQSVEGVSFVLEPAGSRSNYWLNTLALDEADREARDAFISLTNTSGILTRPVWTLLHKLDMYRQCPRMSLTVAENLESRLINIPSSVQLGGDRVSS